MCTALHASMHPYFLMCISEAPMSLYWDGGKTVLGFWAVRLNTLVSMAIKISIDSVLANLQVNESELSSILVGSDQSVWSYFFLEPLNSP